MHPHEQYSTLKLFELTVGTLTTMYCKSSLHTGLVQQTSGECEGRGGRVSTGLLSCISLPPSTFSSSSNLPLPLPLLPMPCQLHISHYRAELPCQQHCINPTALSCSRLSPRGDTASCHRSCQRTDTSDMQMLEEVLSSFSSSKLMYLFIFHIMQWHSADLLWLKHLIF